MGVARHHVPQVLFNVPGLSLLWTTSLEDDAVDYAERRLLQKIQYLRQRLSDEVDLDAEECLRGLIDHFTVQGYEKGSCHDAAEAMVYLLESVFKVAEMAVTRQNVAHAHTDSYTARGGCPCNAERLTMEQTTAALVYHLHLHLREQPLALEMDKLLEQLSATEAVEMIGYRCEHCGTSLDPFHRSSRLSLLGSVLICHLVVPDYMASADFRSLALLFVVCLVVAGAFGTSLLHRTVENAEVMICDTLLATSVAGPGGDNDGRSRRSMFAGRGRTSSLSPKVQYSQAKPQPSKLRAMHENPKSKTRQPIFQTSG